jgi:hypothetical protein
MIWSATPITASTGTFDFIAQLEEGNYATRMERRPVEVDRRISHRYYQQKTVQSENGSRHIPLTKMRAAPLITVGVGTAVSITPDGFELSHNAAADCSVIANAEL